MLGRRQPCLDRCERDAHQRLPSRTDVLADSIPRSPQTSTTVRLGRSVVLDGSHVSPAQNHTPSTRELCACLLHHHRTHEALRDHSCPTWRQVDPVLHEVVSCERWRHEVRTVSLSGLFRRRAQLHESSPTAQRRYNQQHRCGQTCLHAGNNAEQAQFENDGVSLPRRVVGAQTQDDEARIRTKSLQEHWLRSVRKPVTCCGSRSATR
mmetsp:Transcript_61256/g.162844  ORF Transcript_61256/g.162844 Transcript_61256/m.162844 type:complete len:208 (-) Transcript_61256:189-812(-)